ncbi:glycosyltransferase family 39 protein [Phytohabitans aurantiacus]|nr:glycosyltransferase family 39 protein [Phytohabitans aurantiacus]
MSLTVTSLDVVPEQPLVPDQPPADPTSPASQPRWVRPALAALLLGTAVLYLWSLGASGWANSFYSAAAQAGSASWKALFYGSSDAANSITVDKPPASLWLMALSVRVFGLSSWSILVPQALLGVASVGALYATVKRVSGPAAGLLAGAVLALTPVATLMFRFNNPDALLVLLMVLGAYATVRAVEKASARWLALAGVFIGFAFLTKMLQALLVVPAFALAYLIAAPTGIGRRIGHLLLSGLALVLSAGWYVAIVELVPASMRPYIGGSQGNSILELTLGYNGLGRITGEQPGSVGGGGGNGGNWGQAGLTRLFDSEIGGQIAWLLPAALLLLAAGIAVTLRRPRTDLVRASLIVWGGWLLVTGLVFSFMEGIFHAYYTVALAPAVGAVVGTGGVLLWQRRRSPVAAAVLAATVAVTALWSWALLGRSPDWHPWLRVAVLAGGLAAAALLLVAGRLPRYAATAGLAAAVAAALAGPAGYSFNTASTAHSGAIPTAGPSVQGGGPGGGFGGGPGGAGGPGGFRGGTRGGGQAPAFPGGAQGGAAGSPGSPGGGATRGGGGARGGGMGGLLNAQEPNAELKSLLEANSDQYTWVAATVGSNNAAGLQLGTGLPVMAVGGFNGSDPSPTLEQFKQYVAEGKIHYFVGGNGFRANGGSQDSQEIAAWVADTYTAQTVGAQTIYNLTP